MPANLSNIDQLMEHTLGDLSLEHVHLLKVEILLVNGCRVKTRLDFNPLGYELPYIPLISK